MKKIIIILLIISFAMIGCKKQTSNPENNVSEQANNNAAAQEKKVLYVDSYHRGYEWSDDIAKGVMLAFRAKLNDDDTVDNSHSSVELKIFRMDTKRTPDEEHKENVALKAKDIIDWWKPDVVITSDDNAAKYLLMTHYKNATLPFVFCGINFDASKYGLPYSNATGMVEVADYNGVVAAAKKYAKGNKIGFISTQRESDVAMGEYCKSIFGTDLVGLYYLANIKDWKEKFLSLQKDVDVLIVDNYAGIEGWQGQDVENFVFENIKIPLVTTNKHMMRYALIGHAKISEELGVYAAKTALDILNGKSPADIPLTTNKKIKLFLNMKIAKKLGITFPVNYISQAELFEGQDWNAD